MNDVLILRKSEWNGADPDYIEYLFEHRDGNSLVDERGTMCCLGVDLTQRHGFAKEVIRGCHIPTDFFSERDIEQTDELSYFDLDIPHDPRGYDGSIRLETFETAAAEANDNRNITVEEKVQKLTELYATIGVTVEYREDE